MFCLTDAFGQRLRDEPVAVRLAWFAGAVAVPGLPRQSSDFFQVRVCPADRLWADAKFSGDGRDRPTEVSVAVFQTLVKLQDTSFSRTQSLGVWFWLSLLATAIARAVVGAIAQYSSLCIATHLWSLRSSGCPCDSQCHRAPPFAAFAFGMLSSVTHATTVCLSKRMAFLCNLKHGRGERLLT